MTNEAQPECERLKEQILGLFPASAWVEVDTRDSLVWRVIVWGPELRRIRDWVGKCDSEGAALTAACRWFSASVDFFDPLTKLLMVHDLSCALEELSRAGRHPAASSDRAVRRDLAVAAVAFTMQLAIETGHDPIQMRELERTLFVALGTPEVGAAKR